MATYDIIGKGYNTTRQADPFIVDRLCDMLQPHREGLYLDIGCGTGNYLAALSAKGYTFYGVDPSQTMLDAARSAHARAHDLCFIANSVNFPVRHEPEIVVA